MRFFKPLGFLLSSVGALLISGIASAGQPDWQPQSVGNVQPETGFISMDLVSQDGRERTGGWWYQLKSNSDRDWFEQHGLYGQSGREVERSTLSFDQQYKNHTLHWGVAQAGDDRMTQLGMSVGASTLYGFSGSGDTTARIANQFESVGDFHFHGGIRQQYDYSGFRFDYRVNRHNSVGFTHANIKAPALDDRVVYDLNWQGRTMSMSFMQADVGEALAGQALSLAKQFGRHSVSLQGMRASNDATYTGLTFATRTRSGKNLSMKLEQHRNPLYDGANDDRITFGLAFKFGGAPRLYAADTPADGQTEEEAAAEAAKKRRSTGILIGTGAVVGALALSSGSSSSDNSVRKDAQHDVARIALNAVNPMSVQQNREWGGWIFRNADGTYSAGNPVQGTSDNVELPQTPRITESGAEVTASYRTQGGLDAFSDKENFSSQEIAVARINAFDGYLGTPTGQLKFYDHDNDSVSTLGSAGTLAN